MLVASPIIQHPARVKSRTSATSWRSLVEGDEDLYLPKWYAVVFMQCHNIRDST